MLNTDERKEEGGDEHTLYRLQYSVSLQCDSLSGEIAAGSSWYLIAEQVEVRTTRFTELALLQELSTFTVPLIAGLIIVSCTGMLIAIVVKSVAEQG